MSRKNNLKKLDLEDDDDNAFIESEESNSDQSGGEDNAAQSDDDGDHLELDPDDEAASYNEDAADEFDPVRDEELAEGDPDAEEETEVDEQPEETEEPVDEQPEENEEVEVGEDFVVESKTCYAKNLNKDYIVMDEDDSNLYAKLEYKKVPDNERETDPIMTYYEMVRIIGTRAQLFNLGAPPLIVGVEGLHPAKIAYLELMSGMIPMYVRRHLPDKKYEEWRIDELEIIHSIDDEFFVPENFDLDAFRQKNKLL